jgi:hypothetical protein
MIADSREGPIETFLKLITAPVWATIYFGYLSCRRLAEGWSKGKTKPKTKPKRADLNPAWMPATEIERAVYAALILAGEPINNRRLAELMGCSPGEASKRVAQLEDAIRKARKGREVFISLH